MDGWIKVCMVVRSNLNPWTKPLYFHTHVKNSLHARICAAVCLCVCVWLCVCPCMFVCVCVCFIVNVCFTGAQPHIDMFVCEYMHVSLSFGACMPGRLHCAHHCSAPVPLNTSEAEVLVEPSWLYGPVYHCLPDQFPSFSTLLCSRSLTEAVAMTTLKAAIALDR